MTTTLSSTLTFTSTLSHTTTLTRTRTLSDMGERQAGALDFASACQSRQGTISALPTSKPGAWSTTPLAPDLMLPSGPRARTGARQHG